MPHRPALELALLAIEARRRHERFPEARLAVQLLSDLDVVDHRQLAEQTNGLKRSRNTAAGDLVGSQPGDVLATHLDPPGGRAQEACNDVEQRGLAGAVGADDPQDLALSQLELVARQRQQAAEATRDA